MLDQRPDGCERDPCSVGDAAFENPSFQSRSLPTLRCWRSSDVENRAKDGMLSHRIIPRSETLHWPRFPTQSYYHRAMNASDDFLVILSSVGGTRLYGCFDEDIENSGISSSLEWSASKEHSLAHTCAHTKPSQITGVREGVHLAIVVLFYFQG